MTFPNEKIAVYRRCTSLHSQESSLSRDCFLQVKFDPNDQKSRSPPVLSPLTRRRKASAIPTQQEATCGRSLGRVPCTPPLSNLIVVCVGGKERRKHLNNAVLCALFYYTWKLSQPFVREKVSVAKDASSLCVFARFAETVFLSGWVANIFSIPLFLTSGSVSKDNERLKLFGIDLHCFAEASPSFCCGK